jgi:hypothetical protein
MEDDPPQAPRDDCQSHTSERDPDELVAGEWPVGAGRDSDELVIGEWPVGAGTDSDELKIDDQQALIDLDDEPHVGRPGRGRGLAVRTAHLYSNRGGLGRPALAGTDLLTSGKTGIKPAART